MQSETIAIIDLGTNTFHLLIVEIVDADNFIIKEKFKENVKLGEGGINQSEISVQAFERGLAALQKFKALMDSRNTIRALAYATSSIRNATNAVDFIQQVRFRTGIEIKPINGNEEADLIYLGVRYGVNLPAHKDVLIIDIGGGSVEFVVANRMRAKYLRSIEIGAARLLDWVNPSDPLTTENIENAKQIILQKLSLLLEDLKQFSLTTIVGSSGSFETLGLLAALDAGEKHLSENLNGFIFNTRTFKKLHKKLLGATRQQRLELGPIEPMRAEMIPFGSLLIDTIIDQLGIEDIMISSYALKEGILVNYVEETRRNPTSDIEKNQREQVVLQLAKKFNYDAKHAECVARLACSIFDQTSLLHGCGSGERELTYYAALLLDIGHFINRSGHHKHSQYIVQNSAMPGFSYNELLLLGNLVRYHRKSLPSMEHMHYSMLYREHKEMVKKLAGILRIATNLDRAHRYLVENVRLEFNLKQITMWVEAAQPVEIEIEAAMAVRELFELAFDKKLVIKQKTK